MMDGLRNHGMGYVNGIEWGWIISLIILVGVHLVEKGANQ